MIGDPAVMIGGLFGVFLIVAGCSDDPLDDASAIAGWANSSSAMGAFEAAREPAAVSDGRLQTYPDPLCPAVADDGTTTTVTGDCTDTNDRVWTGSVTVTADRLFAAAPASTETKRRPHRPPISCAKGDSNPHGVTH